MQIQPCGRRLIALHIRRIRFAFLNESIPIPAVPTCLPPFEVGAAVFMIQKIRLNLTEAIEAVKSKDALDGFIFAYMIKLTFVSGRINNANTRRICHALGIGNTICRRGLKSALERGYVRQEGNDIIAVNINNRLDYVYPITKNLKRKSERTADDSIRCPFKFTELRKIIREAVIENHILKQNDFSNTHECSVNPHCKKQYLRAKRRIKRMCNKPIVENGDRLSHKRVMKVANIKRSTAKNLMREMVKSKRLTKRQNIEQTDIDIQRELGTSYTEPYFKAIAKHWIGLYTKNVDRGFPILRWRYLNERDCRLMVDIQFANSYKVNHSKINLCL